MNSIIIDHYSDLKTDFVWIDDQPLPVGIDALRELNLLHRLLVINTSYDLDALLHAIINAAESAPLRRNIYGGALIKQFYRRKRFRRPWPEPVQREPCFLSGLNINAEIIVLLFWWLALPI